MYTQFFRLTQSPFSISPDPRYLFMSERHREALAHLLYGVDSGGGIVLLTGDIGTGKTTICRCFLEQVPANCNVAYIFNPKLTVSELLRSICDEFHIDLVRDESSGVKDYVDALNRFLLAAHAEGRNSVLVIDEAQNLSADVLEQLRLLTNLETNERKLLQIILIGQPELRAMLARPELEQLAQRVIAHYHLTALSEQETASYIQHRMTTAGLTTASPFQQPLMKEIHRLTLGVPRRINLLCDRALLGAYANSKHEIDRAIVGQAAAELFINQRSSRSRWGWGHTALLGGSLLLAGSIGWTMGSGMLKSMHAAWTNSTDTAGDGLKKALRIVPVPPTVSDNANPVPPKAPPVASDVPTSAHPMILETNGSSRAGLRNENDALRQLAQLWNLPLDGEDPCEAARTSELRCHKSTGGFAELRRLDRPAMLRLHDQANKPFYALLTGLGDTSAMLRAGDATQEITLAVLTRHFRGEFITLWRAPPGFGKTMETGDTGMPVNWLALQLAKLDGSTQPTLDQPFGPKMVKQVRQFQQAHGLFVDGVVGPVTVMQISRAAGLDEPHLSATRSTQPDGTASTE